MGVEGRAEQVAQPATPVKGTVGFLFLEEREKGGPWNSNRSVGKLHRSFGSAYGKRARKTMRGNNVSISNVIRATIWALLVGLLMAALTLANTPTMVGATDYTSKDKVCVKHKTGSKKNPYNYILIPKNAFENGHKKHGDHKVPDWKCDKDKTTTVTVTATTIIQP
jgi:hypothetical protein